MQMVPLHAGDLPGLVIDVEDRLQEVRSLLEIGRPQRPVSHRFSDTIAEAVSCKL
jgi:hypothetical protein